MDVKERNKLKSVLMLTDGNESAVEREVIRRLSSCFRWQTDELILLRHVVSSILATLVYDVTLCRKFDKTFWFAAFIARLAGAKTVVFLDRLPGFFKDSPSAMEQFCLNLKRRCFFHVFDKVVATTAEIALKVARHSPDEGNCVEVVRSASSGVVDGASVKGESAKRGGVLFDCDVSSSTIEKELLIQLNNIAEELPDVPFYIVGDQKSEAASFLFDLPPNVLIVDRNQARWAYENSLVYCQFSASDNNGEKLVGAMMNGLTPVVSDQGALPEFAWKYGEIVSRSDNGETLAEAIKKALESSDRREMATEASDNHTIERRVEKLKEILNDLF